MNVYVFADRFGYDSAPAPEGSRAEALRFRLTRDVLAVCEGCMAAGIETIRVNEFHGGGRWIDLAGLPREVELVRSPGGLRAVVAGLDDSCDAIMLVGAHPMGDGLGTAEGMTLLPGLNVRLNGRRFGEIGLLAGLAGAHSAVAAMVCGDEAACQEAEGLVPGIRQVRTRRALGGSAVVELHPELVGERLRDVASDAVEACTELQPLWIQKPVQLEVEVASAAWADGCVWIPGIERTGARRLTFGGESLAAVYDVLEGIVRLRA